MIGNVIQSAVPGHQGLPDRRGAVVHVDGADLVVVIIYIRFAGSESLMGDEEAAT